MITVTDTAIEKVQAILSEDDKKGYHLRIGIAGGSCAGFQYYLGLDNEIRENDNKLEFEGFQLLIDPQSAQFMEGATLDYSMDPNNEGFIFNNPNQPPKPEGCGSSCCC